MPISLGKIGGIPIALDYSWFIIFLLIAWSVGFEVMPAEYPRLSTPAYAAIGVTASILLFVSILLHELAHSTVARRNGLKIRRITLFLFGGVSEMEEQPKTASLELRMALAGPLTSVVLAVLLFVAWQISALARVSVFVQAPLNYGALINGLVAGFNMIPAFPLDGGRVLRSLIWRRNGDILRSTTVSAKIARLVAYVLMFGGIFLIFSVDLVSGLWLVIIGWFISSGAQSELRQMLVQEELSTLRAADIMSRRVDTVPPDMKLDQLQEEFARLKHNGFPVLSGGELQGCVTGRDLKKVEKEEWPKRSVSDVMTRREDLAVMGEDEPAVKAMQLMGSRSIGRVIVLGKDGRLSGIITRSDVIRTSQMQEMVPHRQGGLVGGYFTVERGMNFILEQPTFGEAGWRAVYEASQVQMLGEKRVTHMDGREYHQFTFQASRPGILSISLVLEAAPTAGGAPKASRTINYTVTVMDAPAQHVQSPGPPASTV
jgi:Zn-dependent protease/CBS domain-containing protein